MYFIHTRRVYTTTGCSQHSSSTQTYRNDDLIRKNGCCATRYAYTLGDDSQDVPMNDAPMEVNKRKAEVGMVEDAEFHAQLQRYNAFLEQIKDDKVLYLEIELVNTTPQFCETSF